MKEVIMTKFFVAAALALTLGASALTVGASAAHAQSAPQRQTIQNGQS
jgi:hypothetical protein